MENLLQNTNGVGRSFDASTTTHSGDAQAVFYWANIAAFCNAVKRSEIAKIKELFEESPELVRCQSQDKETPLHIVCKLTPSKIEEAKGLEIARFLLGIPNTASLSNLDGNSGQPAERPDILDIKDKFGRTPLQYGRTKSLVELLLRCGADPYSKDKDGNIPLHNVVRNSNGTEGIECVKLLLKRGSADGSMISCNNKYNKTPLHYAVVEGTHDLVELFINGNYKVDLTPGKDFGKTILHHICEHSRLHGETDDSCNIIKTILKKLTEEQVNHRDVRSVTALHLAAIKRHPRMVQILVDDPRTDLMVADKGNRIALHYATEKTCYQGGYRSVEALISRNQSFPDPDCMDTEKRNEFESKIKYLYGIQDENQETPFTLLCKYGSVSDMENYLRAIPFAEIWLKTPILSHIYEHKPSLIKCLFDEAFRDVDRRHDTNIRLKQLNNSNNYEELGQLGVVFVDFGSITGYQDPIEYLKQPETHYLNKVLHWELNIQKEILLHPLVQLFMLKKWEKLTFINWAWIFSQLIWLCAYSVLASTKRISSAVDSEGIYSSVASIIMLIYVAVSAMSEVWELYILQSVHIYIQKSGNWAQILQIILALFSTWPLWTQSWSNPAALSHYATSIGIVLAYVRSLRDVGKIHKTIGMVVEVLLQVVKKIFIVLIICSPLFIGFTFAFPTVYPRSKSLSSTFPGPYVKVLVMMLGELEYDAFNSGEDYDYLSDNNQTICQSLCNLRIDKHQDDAEHPPINPIFAICFYLFFLIGIPISFLNLLTAFALEKVQEMKKRAKLYHLANQVDHAFFIESLLLNIHQLDELFLGCLPVSWLRRKLNVTYDRHEYKFDFLTSYKLETEPKRMSLFGWLLDVVGMHSESCSSRVISRKYLPAEVIDNIFELAYNKLRGNDKSNHYR